MSETGKKNGIQAPQQCTWYAIDVSCEPQACEAVEYALMEAGALGTVETKDGNGELVHPVAYFATPPERERVREALFDAMNIYGLASHMVRDMQFCEVTNCDWLAEWKKGWQPVEVGQRFLIAPPWSEVSEQPDRIVLRIEPGMAFGTGTHETTRLCLAAIEKYFEGGSFLDVGTGTGILAIAAAKLQPTAHVEACDADGDCITIAHENARLNQVSERINFREGTIEEDTACVDCVCANLTADVILPLLPTLTSVTCGRLILSGILITQIPLITTRLRQLGIMNWETMTEGEWAAVIV